MISPLLSGLLSGITLPTSFGSFKFPDLGLLTWIALVPLYLLLKGTASARKGFRSGFFWGLAHYGLSLYWIFIAMHTYGEIPVWGSLLGLTAAVAIESLFPAAASALAVFLAGRRVPLFLSLPVAWVVQDFARTYFPFGGLAWSSLAYSQHSFLTLLQILDLTGVYGILFLLLLANALLAETWLFLRRRGAFPIWPAAAFSLLFLGSIAYGRHRLAEVRKEIVSRETMTVSIIQGNIPQEDKWQEENIDEILNLHMAMTREAEKQDPDLIVWPEAAYPAVVPPEIIQIDFFKDLKVPLLAGLVSYEGRIPLVWPPHPDDRDFRLYNSAFLFEPGGYIAGRYHKNHLVPMGEYVPLGRILFFLSQIVPSISSFTPGKELNLLTVQGEREANFGVTICYEDLFPEISRSFTRQGADFLVNLTNDGWYERSSAVYQHFDFSRYRAIENRRTMVRATNTGVTGFFSPTGEVIAKAPVFKEAILTAAIPLGGLTSLYTRYGDLFAWGCVAALGLLILKSITKGRRHDP
jgi:apolipoprotein N-acyltransferase